MQIFNVGPVELILILLLMFVLLGPREMVRSAQRIGKFIRDITHSPMWKEIMSYTNEIRDVRDNLIKETGITEVMAEVRDTTQGAFKEISAEMKSAADAVRFESGEINKTRIDLDGSGSQATGESNTIAPPAQLEAPAADETAAALAPENLLEAGEAAVQLPPPMEAPQEVAAQEVAAPQEMAPQELAAAAELPAQADSTAGPFVDETPQEAADPQVDSQMAPPVEQNPPAAEDQPVERPPLSGVQIGIPAMPYRAPAAPIEPAPQIEPAAPVEQSEESGEKKGNGSVPGWTNADENPPSEEQPDPHAN